MKKGLIASLVLVFFGLTACQTKENIDTPISHGEWNTIVSQYVDAKGDVDYSSMKNDKSKVDAYLEYLKENSPRDAWSDNKEMAYWINLYNAFTIQTILSEYPVASITDIDNGNVWSTRLINVGGTNYTLDQIEVNNLLNKFGEERVHFAVNCAAKSCPPLLNKAWTEDNIEQGLEQVAMMFVNDTIYNTINTNSVDVSQIFNWYANDFGGGANIVNYLQNYSNTPIDSTATVTFKSYDWGLNEQ